MQFNVLSTVLGTKYLCNTFHSVKWQFMGFCYIEEDEVFFIHLSFFWARQPPFEVLLPVRGDERTCKVDGHYCCGFDSEFIVLGPIVPPLEKIEINQY